MWVPFMSVYFWAGPRFKKEWMKYYGIAFLASGVSVGIGAQFFGLAVAGRFGQAAIGPSAVIVAVLMAGLGAISIIMHYLVITFKTIVHQGVSNEKKNGG